MKFSADNILKYFSYFPRKQNLTCHANCLCWRRFAWNVKSFFFFFSSENRIWHFMQIVSTVVNLHEMSNSVFWEIRKTKTGFNISCTLSPVETICMKYQSLFPGKNKKNIIKLSAAELAKRVVKVKFQQVCFIACESVYNCWMSGKL